MHRPTSKTLTLLFALTLAACKTEDGGSYGAVPKDEAPKTYADLYCDLLQTCDCNFPVTPEQCVDGATQEFEMAFAEAETAGLIYDAECMGEYLNYFEQVGCKTTSELIADPNFAGFSLSTCKVFSGSAVEGEACTNYYEVYGDSCVQGLYCAGDTCIKLADSPTTKQIGETCDPQSEICEEGSLCLNSADAPMTYSCVALPKEGESCMDTYLCAPGIYCDTLDFVCKGPVGEGEACDGFSITCQDGLYCDNAGQTCVPTLAEGQPCEGDEQCGEGFECDDPIDGNGNVCMPEGALVCP